MPVTTDLSSLKRYRANLNAAIDRGTARGAGFILNVAQQLVPVDSGDLKASGELHPEPGSGDGRYTVSFGGSGVDYAAFVEYGTPDSAAQPFLRPAIDAIDLAAEVAAELRKLR